MKSIWIHRTAMRTRKIDFYVVAGAAAAAAIAIVVV